MLNWREVLLLFALFVSVAMNCSPCFRKPPIRRHEAFDHRNNLDPPKVQDCQTPIFVIYDTLSRNYRQIWRYAMSSPKAIKSLARLGVDVRAARLRRGMAVSDLAVRASTSASTVARFEKGDPGVSIGAFANILLALGLVERLAELFDMRNDALGLAITAERAPKRGRSSAATGKLSGKVESTVRTSDEGIDAEGMAF